VAVAVGYQTSGGAIEHLAPWATHILIVDGNAWGSVPKEHAAKCVNMDVGPDRWVNPYHPELAAKFRELIEARLTCLE
jgi:hypothetical protein